MHLFTKLPVLLVTSVHQFLSLFQKCFYSWAGEKSNGDRSDSPGAGKGTPGSMRMLTRLRNPDSKLSQMKSQQVAAAANEANKLYKETREVCARLENLKNYKKCSGKMIISLNNTKFCLKVFKSCFVSFQAMEVLFKKAVIIN